MKYITRFITLSLLAAAIIVPFFIKTGDGGPTLGMPTADDFIPDKLLPDSLTGNKSETSSNSSKMSSTQTFHKWQDENGQWHYGDTPPPGSQNVTDVSVNTQANIIQAVKVESEFDKVKPLEAEKPKLSKTLTDGKLTIDDAMNVMNDASAVRDMMEHRNKALESIAGQ